MSINPSSASHLNPQSRLRTPQRHQTDEIPMAIPVWQSDDLTIMRLELDASSLIRNKLKLEKIDRGDFVRYLRGLEANQFKAIGKAIAEHESINKEDREELSPPLAAVVSRLIAPKWRRTVMEEKVKLQVLRDVYSEEQLRRQ